MEQLSNLDVHSVGTMFRKLRTCSRYEKLAHATPDATIRADMLESSQRGSLEVQSELVMKTHSHPEGQHDDRQWSKRMEAS